MKHLALISRAWIIGTFLVLPLSASAETGSHAEGALEDAHGADVEPAAGHHESGHGHDGHVPRFSDINWFYGLVGEKEGAEPSLLWRPVGMPVPFGALILNTAILFFLIGRFGGPSIKEGLVGRKERIAGDIESAARMKAEAEQQLAHYEGKLAEMEADMKRIREEMRLQAEADRVQILADAQKRRDALESEARVLLAQELSQARQDATQRAVTGAVQAAREQIQKHLTAQDQERLARDLLGSLQVHLKKEGAQS